MGPLTPDQAPGLTPNEVATLNFVADGSTTFFGTSPSGLVLLAAMFCVGLWVAQRIDVVSAAQARMSAPAQVVLAALVVTVARVQSIRLQREIHAWMSTDPTDRWALVVPGETVPVRTSESRTSA